MMKSKRKNQDLYTKRDYPMVAGDEITLDYRRRQDNFEGKTVPYREVHNIETIIKDREINEIHKELKEKSIHEIRRYKNMLNQGTYTSKEEYDAIKEAIKEALLTSFSIKKGENEMNKIKKIKILYTISSSIFAVSTGVFGTLLFMELIPTSAAVTGVILGLFNTILFSLSLINNSQRMVKN